MQICSWLITNLFSITKALTNKWNLSNKGELIVLNKGNNQLIFDKIIKTENGQVLGIEMEGLKLKVEYNTKDYLSCEILFNEKKKKAWLGQPHLMKKIFDKRKL